MDQQEDDDLADWAPVRCRVDDGGTVSQTAKVAVKMASRKVTPPSTDRFRPALAGHP
ncbi:MULTISPECIES: hypothetical protein [Cryobacterium]|uniref:hypothetical protein n=1 Tax=Cryobacterium sp. Sr8 TaxID=1259203 RepID=UPI00141A9D54